MTEPWGPATVNVIIYVVRNVTLCSSVIWNIHVFLHFFLLFINASIYSQLFCLTYFLPSYFLISSCLPCCHIYFHLRRNCLLHSHIFDCINRIIIIHLLSQSRNFGSLKAPCSKNPKLRSWNCKVLYLSWPRKRLLMGIIDVYRTYRLNIKAHLKIISRKVNKCHLIWISFAFMKVTSTFVTSVSAKGTPLQGRPINNEWTRSSVL
jgi:hypothetical protein